MKTKQIKNLLNSRKDHGIFILRLGIALVFLYYSIFDKFISPDSTIFLIQNFLNNINISLPVNMLIFVRFIGILELAVAVSLIFGIFTRLGALLGTFLLIPILFIAKIPNDIAVLGALISLIYIGAGKISIDNKIKNKIDKMKN